MSCSNSQSAAQELADFEDGQVLNTLLEDYNLTVHVDVTNGADIVTLESFGSIATIITPPQYACNVKSARNRHLQFHL